MRIKGVIWLRNVVDKLAVKHHVKPYEVEQALSKQPKIRFVEKGERRGEDVYMDRLGKQTLVDTWRYSLFIREHMRR